MALMPASRNTPMNELPRQMLKRLTLKKAQAPPPNALSTAYFMFPMKTLKAVGIGGLSVQYPPKKLTLAGECHGRKNGAKTRAPPPDGRASTDATPHPR